MCLSNEEIREILKIQRRRYLARVRHNMTLKDGNNVPYTKERAELCASYNTRVQGISYENFQKRQKRIAEGKYVEHNGFWHLGIPDIVRQRCPIPYMPEMPLTRCLECTSPYRKISQSGGEKHAVPS